jgi:hypothetical protein
MQGFVNFADDIGVAISILIPTICYLVGVSFIMAAGWGFMQLSKGAHGRIASHPWMPFVTLFIGAALLSYDRMLNLAEATIGSAQTASMSDGLTSYTPPTVNPASLVGNSPEQTILNVINVFEYFFVCYGALIVLGGILALKYVSEGRRRHGPSLAIVQIVFGLAVMNIDTIAPTIMGYFA